MRPFEIILLVAITILPFVMRKLARHFRPIYINIALGVLTILHLIAEGYRWQMIPAYLLVILIGWRIQVLDAGKQVRLSFLRLAGFFGVSVLILLAWILPVVLPVFSLPEPRGPYNVGTELITVKTELDETITENPSDKRELVYKIWYPSNADVSVLESEQYVDKASRSGFATKYGLSPSMLDYLDHVETFVYRDLPIAKGSFPVLVFTHGYGSKATGYYALLTELASQGYVIINMNHPYESLGVTYPDGRIVYFDYEYQQEISAEFMEVMGSVMEAFSKGFDYEERHPIVSDAVKIYFEGDIQNRWAEDILSTLDLLDDWNENELFQGRLDLDRIGVLGHSVGGGTAGNVAMKDSRVKAAANLDGIQWGGKIDTTYHVPYLYISADWPADHEDINSHIYKYKSTDVFYEAKLLNSGHPNFMDIPFMVPVPTLAATGEIDPYHGMEIVTNLVTSFFDRHLKNVTSADPQNVGRQYEMLEMSVYQGDVSLLSQ